MISLNLIAIEVGKWASVNFPNRQDWQAVVGMQEELGELAHAFLKRKLGIRHSNAEALEKEQDAIGDLLIFLLNHCDRQGFNVEKILTKTWEKVSKRNWRSCPMCGNAQEGNSYCESCGAIW